MMSVWHSNTVNVTELVHIHFYHFPFKHQSTTPDHLYEWCQHHLWQMTMFDKILSSSI